MTERMGRKCFNCQSIYGCKIIGGITNDCVSCTVYRTCTVICTGDTTGGACPACMKVHELTKILKKEGI